MGSIKPVIELELYLVRHGQSKGNVGFGDEQVTFTEMNDPRLSELGLKQAKKAGKYLSGVEFDACYSSALVRTVMTANEIMSYQKEKKPLNVLPLVTEVAVEEVYKGRPMEEIRTFCDSAVVAEGFSEEEGLLFYNPRENEKPIFERAVKATEYLRSRYNKGEKVLVTGHAAFGTVMIFHIMGYTESPVYDIEISNTGITHIIFYKKGTNRFGDIVFETINDTKHFCIPDEEILPQSLSETLEKQSGDTGYNVKNLVSFMKKVHSEKADNAVDIRVEKTRMTDEIMHLIPVEKWQKLRSLVTGAQATGTRLAISDANSVFSQDGGICCKESETGYMGYPVFDLANLYESLVAIGEFDENATLKKFGFSHETAQRIWAEFLLTYFEGEEKALISRADDRARVLTYLNIFHRLTRSRIRDDKAFAYCKEKLIEYIIRVGSLDFE